MVVSEFENTYKVEYDDGEQETLRHFKVQRITQQNTYTTTAAPQWPTERNDFRVFGVGALPRIDSLQWGVAGLWS